MVLFLLLLECQEEQCKIVLFKKTKKEKIPVKKCYQCLIPCDVKNTPYCISRALIEAVKGNLEDGLIFTGAHGYRQDHLMHVDEVIHELMEDDK